MVEQRQLSTVDQHRVVAPITLRVETDAARQVQMTAVAETETFGPIVGVDVMDALIEVRRQLEDRGLVLCCQGARRNVWASGQLRQFTDGERGYVLTEVRSTDPDDPFEIVDLLDAAPADQVVSLGEQHQFIRAFYSRAPTGSEPRTPVEG